ncbi:MAG: hypothetical protein NZZ41_06765, partial [Candidatus Dojkabacteria bacterium]|nr:hypothetical protein [Candidatus Dojkabacteria bacterium]
FFYSYLVYHRNVSNDSKNLIRVLSFELFSIYKLKRYLLQFVSSLFKVDYKNLFLFIFIGLCIGISNFWNGAIFICIVLFCIFFLTISKYKLNYILLIFVAIFIGLLQYKFFTRGNIQSIDVRVGYLAAHYDDNVSLFMEFNELVDRYDIVGVFQRLFKVLGEIIDFLFVLNGIGLAVSFIVFLFLPLLGKFLYIIFISPLFVSFIFQFTPDVATNHKFLVISFIFINFYIAFFVYKLYLNKYLVIKVLCLFSVILFSFTGVIDIISFINRNNEKFSVELDFSNDFYRWLVEETPKDSIFLTDYIHIHLLPAAGRKLFMGWPYYAWSAGYDTYTRANDMKLIYSSNDLNIINFLLRKYKINYILIDMHNRTTNEYVLNEKIFDNNFTIVYKDTASNVKVYKVI